jgi:hypothetical protein
VRAIEGDDVTGFRNPPLRLRAPTLPAKATVTYSAPNDGARYFLDLPSGHVFYSRYIVTLVGDPTSGMTTTFDTDDGHLSVSGTCTTNLTTDRGQVVPSTGTFDGKLAWNGTKFEPAVTWTC